MIRLGNHVVMVRDRITGEALRREHWWGEFVRVLVLSFR
jgi:hypothetical protein